MLMMVQEVARELLVTCTLHAVAELTSLSTCRARARARAVPAANGQRESANGQRECANG